VEAMGLEPTNLFTASYFWLTFTHRLELRQSGKCQVKLCLSAELASIYFPLLPRPAGDDVGKMWGSPPPRSATAVVTSSQMSLIIKIRLPTNVTQTD